MKIQEKLPLPIRKVADDLDEMEVEAMVTRAAVSYDESAIGTDIYLTLHVRIEDAYNERRKTPEQKFDNAMKVL